MRVIRPAIDGGVFAELSKEDYARFTSGKKAAPPGEFTEQELDDLRSLKSRGLRARVDTIPSGLAEEYLQTSVGNRTISGGNAQLYQADMADGNWVVNGESIVFDGEGHLIDGHTRLTAAARSGVTIESVVIRGVEHSAFKTIDTGKSRSSADLLSIDKVLYSGGVAAAIRWSKVLETGFAPGSIRLSTTELMEIFTADKEAFVEAATVAHGLNKMASAAVVGAIYYKAKKIDPELTTVFFEKLRTGENLSRDNPIYRLRERLSRPVKAGAAGRKSRASQEEVSTLIIRTWNMVRTNKPAANLVGLNYDRKGKIVIPKLL